MKKLYTKQGLQEVLQVLKHLCTKTTLSKLITTTIDAYQLQAGIPSHVLIDTKPLLWMPARWVTQLQEFLYSIKGTIQLDNPWLDNTQIMPSGPSSYAGFPHCQPFPQTPSSIE